MTAVAQVVNTLDVGGAERVAVSLANGLASSDCNAHLIVTRRSGALRDELSPDVAFFSAGRRVRLDWAALRRMGRYIDEQEIDLLHAHDSATAVVLRLALVFARRSPLQIVHNHSGRDIDDRSAGLFNRIFLRHLAGHISVSDGLRKLAEEQLSLPPQRCIWIPNGISVSPPREPYQGPPTVIQVANLREPKGHRIAMECAAKLRAEVPNLRWLCVGRCEEGSDYVRDVRRQIGELGLSGCVELLGERHDVRELLRHAHIGVLSSDFEGLPLAILEYMAESLPVAATRVGQVPTILEASGGGVVTPVGDASTLADEILRMLQHEPLRREMGANGRDHVAQKFSVEAMISEVKVLYREIFSERGWRAPSSWDSVAPA